MAEGLNCRASLAKNSLASWCWGWDGAPVVVEVWVGSSCGRGCGG
jgi:hypothetical protein